MEGFVVLFWGVAFIPDHQSNVKLYRIHNIHNALQRYLKLRDQKLPRSLILWIYYTKWVYPLSIPLPNKGIRQSTFDTLQIFPCAYFGYQIRVLWVWHKLYFGAYRFFYINCFRLISRKWWNAYMHTADYFHFWHLRNFTLLFFNRNEKNSAALITL